MITLLRLRNLIRSLTRSLKRRSLPRIEYLLIEVHHYDGKSLHGKLTDVSVDRSKWELCESEQDRLQLLSSTIGNQNICSGPWAIIQYTIDEVLV